MCCPMILARRGRTCFFRARSGGVGEGEVKERFPNKKWGALDGVRPHPNKPTSLNPFFPRTNSVRIQINRWNREEGRGDPVSSHPIIREQRRRDMFDEKGEGVNLSACVAKRGGRARTQNASLGLRLPSPFVCLCPARSLNAEGNEEEEDEEGVC